MARRHPGSLSRETRTPLRLLATAFLSILGLGAQASADSSPTRLLRFPAINGEAIVFSYAGQLYTVSAGGGTARRLTDGPGYAIGQEGWERSRFNLGLSLGWRARDGWSWTGEYNGAFSNGEAMNGLRIKGSKAF